MLRLAGALALFLVLTAACSDGEAADYDGEFHDEFVNRCVDAYTRPGGEQVCGCWYDQVSAQVAFEDLPSIDDLLGDDFDQAPTRLPGSDMDVPMLTLAECVRSVGAQPTMGTAPPPPTTPRPPTTLPPTTTVPA